MTGFVNSVRCGKRAATFTALLSGVSVTVLVLWSVANREAGAQTDTKLPAATKKLAYSKALSNAKKLGIACLLKEFDEGRVFKINPATFRKDIAPYVADPNGFTSPLDKPGTQSFQFNKGLQNVPEKRLKSPQNVVMLYEGAWKKPLFRYNGAAIVVFADGHTKPVTPAQAKDLVWKP